MTRTGHFVNDLRATFAARADHDAVIASEASFTFRELDRSRSMLGIVAAGRRVLRPGDRVAISTPKKLHFLMAHLGTLFAGAVSLPLNPRMTRDELRYLLEDSGARMVVAGDEGRPTHRFIADRVARAKGSAGRLPSRNAGDRSFCEPAVRSRCTLLDALQLGHDGATQGGCAQSGKSGIEPSRLEAIAGGSRPMTCL